MKTLGLIGGMSWESTLLYYQVINRHVREKLEIESLQASGDWEQAGKRLQEAAHKLEQAGANAIVLCTNTMHRLALAIESGTTIPLLHIADLTAQEICSSGFRRVGLLGTRYTMIDDFYKGRLADKYSLEVVVPSAPDIEIVHDIIYDELCKGVVREESRQAYIAIISRLGEAGAECVILGCTEIGMLVGPEHVSLPVFDSTIIHATRAADWSIRELE